MPLASLIQAIPQDKKSLSPLQWTNEHHAHFASSFDQLQSLFAQKKLLKAVPYVFETAGERMDNARLLRSLASMLRYALAQPLFIYGFWGDDAGMLRSISGALFRTLNNGILETVACAGTYGRDKSQKNMLSDVKELHEHNLVVEGITESLEAFGRVGLGSTSILQLPSLSILRADTN